jgi:long-subunit fatty acid transport protein
MRYTDWTQMGFSYDDPAFAVDESDALQFIQDNLKEVVSLQLGGEFLIPEQGLTLRAGYFRDPLPVDGKFIDKERQYFTAGVGLLIDRIMTLDVAYVHGGFKLRDADPGMYTAEYKTRRLYATFGYRI